MKSSLELDRASDAPEDAFVGRMLAAAVRNAPMRAAFPEELEQKLRRLPPPSRPAAPRTLVRLAPAAAAVAAAGVLFSYSWHTTPTVSAAALLQRAADASDVQTFVPTGMVRHIVTDISSNTSGTSTLDQWFANGPHHIVMRQTQGGIETVVSDTAVWKYQPDLHRVDVMRFADPRWISAEPWIPKPVSAVIGNDKAKGYNSRVVGTTHLNGHLVEEVEASDASSDYKYWIDTHTYAVLQSESRYVEVSPTGQTSIRKTTKLVSDTLEPASDVSPDFFSFSPPAGATVNYLGPARPSTQSAAG